VKVANDRVSALRDHSLWATTRLQTDQVMSFHIKHFIAEIFGCGHQLIVTLSAKLQTLSVRPSMK
jgi:hypothetical protein